MTKLHDTRKTTNWTSKHNIMKKKREKITYQYHTERTCGRKEQRNRNWKEKAKPNENGKTKNHREEKQTNLPRKPWVSGYKENEKRRRN